MKKVSPQPAKKNYMLGDALKKYKQFFASIKDYTNSIQEDFYYYQNDKKLFIVVLFVHIMLIIEYSCVLLVSSIVAIGYGLVLLFGVCISYIMYGIAISKEKRYIKQNNISFVCPECQSIMTNLPAFECPTCKRVHTQLIPSEYGIFHRKCICGTLIPTMFSNGKDTLQPVCPNCMNKVLNPKFSSICIDIIGQKGVGKFALIKDFYTTLSNSSNIKKITPANEYIQSIINYPLDTMIDNIKNGNKSLDIFLDSDKFNGITKFLHMYIFKNSFQLNDESKLKLRLQNECITNNALIFVIDVFTIESIYLKYGTNTEYINTTQGNNAVIFDHFLSLYRKYRGIEITNIIDTPVMILLNNMRYIPQEEYLSNDKVQDVNKKQLSEEQTKSILIEKFLIDNGLSGLIYNLRSSFNNIGFFADSDELKAINWILSQVDNNFKDI